MPLSAAEQFLQKIGKGEPPPGILLLGDDLYWRDLCRAKLVEAFAPEEAREWAVTRFSAEETGIERVLQQAQTLPMLAPRQVIFVEDVDALEKLGDAARDATLEQLSGYFDDPAPFTVLVFEAAQLDQRMKLFKLLNEKALVVGLSSGERPQEREAAAAAMALRMARELGVEIGRDAASLLAGLLNGELARIRMELEKLASYVGARKSITAADVEALVVSAKKYSVWQLADMLASRQRDRALEFLDSLLREGEQPPALVGALAWMVRKLLEAQELSPHLSGWQAARALGMRPETAELALRQARKIPRAQLLEGLAALYEADNRLKSGVADDRAVLEFLVVRLTAAQPGAAAKPA